METECTRGRGKVCGQSRTRGADVDCCGGKRDGGLRTRVAEIRHGERHVLMLVLMLVLALALALVLVLVI